MNLRNIFLFLIMVLTANLWLPVSVFLDEEVSEILDKPFLTLFKTFNLLIIATPLIIIAITAVYIDSKEDIKEFWHDSNKQLNKFDFSFH